MKEKIVIIGSSGIGTMAQKLQGIINDKFDVEFREAKEQAAFKREPIPLINYLPEPEFRLPLTRKERRKLTRKP